MTMPVTTRPNGDKTTAVVDMKAQITFGRQALHELRLLIRNRPDPVIINGKRYLEFCDWQILGAFFGITPYVVSTKEITRDKKLGDDAPFSVLEVIGFLARAEARQNGSVLSAAEAECMFDEKNWKGKPRFQLRSMAETRACAKVLRQCLQWVVKLPDDKGKPPAPVDNYADESVEEMQTDPMG